MEAIVFRLGDNAPDMLREVCLERGWEEYQEDRSEGDGDWNLWWKTQGFTALEFEQSRPWQRLNHFPKSSIITKKDGLARNLRRMRTSYGGALFNFFPVTFVLPNEYKKFVAEFSKEEEGQRNYWICKPTEQSCGRGIFIFQDLHDLTYDCAVVVQKYIVNPLLISGYKFDLRLYVIVTSFHPFQLYIYHEGLVRFSTERFDLSTLDNRFSHLTNTSINKKGPQYSADKESIGTGCKWTLSQLRVYLHKQNIDDRLLWHRITSVILITVLSLVQEVPSNSSNSFELFGFDILVDEKLKPWLLEVNFSPALGNDCLLDEMVKKPLLNDILNTLNFVEADVKRGKKEKETAVRNRSKAKDRMNNHPSICRMRSEMLSRPIGTHAPRSNCNSTPPETVEEISRNAGLVSRKDKTGQGMGLGNRTNRNLGGVAAHNFGFEKANFARRCSLGSRVNQLHHGRLGASEEFVKAAENNGHVSAEEPVEKANLQESKTLLNCTSNHGDCALETKINGTVIEEQSQGVESADSHVTTQYSERRNSTSTNSQFTPCFKTATLPPHLALHRYHSEASVLNSLHRTSILSRGMLPGGFPSQYSLRVPITGKRGRQKNNHLVLQPQIGNCILAFPFNEVTHKINRGKLDHKVVVEEIRKIMKVSRCNIKASPRDEKNEDGTSSFDVTKPFWGYRSRVNTFYSSI